MQKCTKCGEEKPSYDFSYKVKKTHELRKDCKVCQAKVIKANYLKKPELHRTQRDNYRNRRMAEIRELKNRPCVDCGKQYEYFCMDFDHTEDNKRCGVSRLAQGGFYKKALEEAAKCEVVCCLCHRYRTQARIEARKK